MPLTRLAPRRRSPPSPRRAGRGQVRPRRRFVFDPRIIISPQSRTICQRIPPRTEGCLISIFRHGAGSGGRGMTFRWRCGEAARRSKPRALRPAHAAGRQAVVRRPCRKARRLKNGSPPGALRSKPNKHRARDALGLADLRHARRRKRRREPDLRKASMSRGVEARGSEHFRLRKPRKLECAPGPMRPARPRYFFRGASGGMAMRPTRGRPKNTGGGALAFLRLILRSPPKRKRRRASRRVKAATQPHGSTRRWRGAPHHEERCLGS